MRKLFAILAVLLATSAILQLYFAAMGVFSNPDDELFAIHGINGQYVLRFLPLLMIIIGAIGKVGKKLIWQNVWVIILTIVQLLLFILAGVLFGATEESANVPIGATILLSFHGLVGLAIIVLTMQIVAGAMGLGFPKKAAAESTTTTP